MDKEQVLQSIFNHPGVSELEINEAIEFLKNSHKPENLGSIIDYNKEANRLAYRYLYVSIHSAAVKKYFLEFAKTNGYKSWAAGLNSNSVSIMSIGGGPGSEHLGLLQAFYENNQEIQSVKCINFDKCTGWKTEFAKLLALFARSNNLHYSRRMVFRQCDLLNYPLPRSFVDSIKNVDIATLVKFLSSFPNNPQQIRIFLQTVCMNMKEGALLFYLDGSGDSEKHSLLSEIASSNNLIDCNFTKSCIFKNDESSENTFFNSQPLNQLKLRVTIWKKLMPFDGGIIQGEVVPQSGTMEDYIFLRPSDLQDTNQLLYNLQFCTLEDMEDNENDMETLDQPE